MKEIDEQIYHQAVSIWKIQNSNQKYLDIPITAVIEVPSYGMVAIGDHIKKNRQIYKAMQQGKRYRKYRDLSPEQIDWWNQQGMIWDYEAWMENNYRQAALLWKQQNPTQRRLNIDYKTRILISGIGEIKLGSRLHVLRKIYQEMQQGKHYQKSKDLSPEQIAWWEQQGMIWNYEKWIEDNYRQAALLWKKEHPEEKSLKIPTTATQFLDGVGDIRIGQQIAIMRRIYKAMQQGKHYQTSKDLTKEQITWWEQQGMIWDYYEWKRNSSPRSQTINQKVDSDSQLTARNSTRISLEQLLEPEYSIPVSERQTAISILTQYRNQLTTTGVTQNLPIESLDAQNQFSSNLLPDIPESVPETEKRTK